MTFKDRYWAYLTRKGQLFSIIFFLVFITIVWATGHVDALQALVFIVIVSFWGGLVPPLFYARAKIDPGADHLHDSFLTEANWPLALAYIFWLPLFLVCLALYQGYFPNYYAIIFIVWIGWPLFIRIKLREEVRAWCDRGS